ncbi:hypothetical protein GCM10011575_41700 [Microlunatus endophyticus]|uniref:AAA domain-containing protein n=1 Tax=Microlunatus endophyticus TaxID=1716077 RepID=A0A917SHJ0_9ACTN|nr:AAA family ATPase [Microlunatus endophyticus]GGL79020.1 hypothetical protein GCM10011575_41700 [Microlunatus endophyticus]
MATPTNYNKSRVGLLIVISGPAAAGKTTIGREIAARRNRAIHIDGDFIQGLIVTGSIKMDVPPPPGALDQLRLRFQAALAVANLYRDAGFDAIISDNLFEEEAHRFIQSAISSHPSRLIHFVMLNPSVEAIWERYNQRPEGGYTASLTPEVLKDAVERTARVGLWLDTSHLTAGQTAEQVLERLDQAEVRPEAPTAGSNGRPSRRP